MARRASFVVTASLAVLTPACGGETGSGSNGNPASGGGGGASDGGVDAGAAGACPVEVGHGVVGCLLEGESCDFSIDCQGGPRTFHLVCTAERYELEPMKCDPSEPYDFCAGSGFWCSGSDWMLPIFPNPPVPCPATPPTAGVECPVTFGGTQSPCGYPCATDSGQEGWQFASCAPTSSEGWIIGACQ